MAFIESRRDGTGLSLALAGSWRAAQIVAIRAEFAQLDVAGADRVTVDPAGADIDLAGAWELDVQLQRLAAAGVAAQFTGEEPATLRVVRDVLRERRKTPRVPDAGDDDPNPVYRIGKTVVERLRELQAGLAFVGRVTVTQLRALSSLRRMRLTSVTRHVWDTGITALPIVALIAFLISIIIAYLSASQLQAYGADIFVVDLITVGVLRELGVLLTAIIIAGRSGSAFAAELGSMRLNEEVDALEATGVDTVEMLILPRVVGLTIALPLLTFVADVIGMAGGAILCNFLLDMPLQQFINRAEQAIAPTTFWVGILKAPVFAVLIALAGTYRGLQVRGSSRELGRLTTTAVVQSIFLVLLADAMFAILFMQLDI